MSGLSGGVKHGVHSAFMKMRAAVTPVPTVSQFEKERTLIPEEFVQAGDYLVQAFPSWEWYGGVPSKRKNFLGGDDKQCLVIRKVPTNPIVQTAALDIHQQEDDDWICAGDVTAHESQPTDIDVPEIGDEIDDDPGALPSQQQNSRLYDLYITYDHVYRVPRFWLVGYHADLTPLTSEQICSDVSPDHAGWTLTWDPHPHEDFHSVSVHPCRHAAVMKELLDAMEEGGKTVVVDQYIPMFVRAVFRNGTV